MHHELQSILDASRRIVFFGGAGVSTHTVQLHRKKGRDKMKTVEDIIAFLQAELAEAYELHDQAKGKDAQEALFHIIRATVITHILEEIE